LPKSESSRDLSLLQDFKEADKPLSANETHSVQHPRRPAINQKKYYSLVSPVLRLLRGEDSSSDSDSSSDTDKSESQIMCDTLNPALPSEVKTRCNPCHQSPEADSLSDDFEDLYSQLAKLGLPSAFGSTKKPEPYTNCS
uniref:Peroxisome proliferator-activated receptor gamma coactivator 1-beta n=1 Tax=Echinostoma caproni TaxID=27848 RepID=A0A183A026_9TREM